MRNEPRSNNNLGVTLWTNYYYSSGKKEENQTPEKQKLKYVNGANFQKEKIESIRKQGNKMEQTKQTKQIFEHEKFR